MGTALHSHRFVKPAIKLSHVTGPFKQNKLIGLSTDDVCRSNQVKFPVFKSRHLTKKVESTSISLSRGRQTEVSDVMTAFTCPLNYYNITYE